MTTKISSRPLPDPAPVRSTVTSCGTEIVFDRYEKASSDPETGVVLVHGNLAHRGWWRRIAPGLSTSAKVAAIDLAGMGDSATRGDYHPDKSAEDILAVGAALGVKRLILVGHSYGGAMVANAARRFADREWPFSLDGVVFIDSPMRFEPYEPGKPFIGKQKYYESREAVLSRYRLIPEQPVTDEGEVRRIAEESIIETADGWRWKFDGNRPMNTGPILELWQNLRDTIDALPCARHFIAGEHSSLCDAEWREKFTAFYADRMPLEVMPDCWHHVLLDDPEELTRRLAHRIAVFTG